MKMSGIYIYPQTCPHRIFRPRGYIGLTRDPQKHEFGGIVGLFLQMIIFTNDSLHYSIFKINSANSIWAIQKCCHYKNGIFLDPFPLPSFVAHFFYSPAAYHQPTRNKPFFQKANYEIDFGTLRAYFW